MRELSQTGPRVSRRTAIQLGAASAVAIAAPCHFLFADRLSVDQWKPLVGQDFQILKISFDDQLVDGDPSRFQNITVKLIDAVELKTKTQNRDSLPAGITAHPIALYFRTTADVQLDSLTFDVWNQKSKVQKLFFNRIFEIDNNLSPVYESIIG